MTTPAVLALEDGTVFRGISIGAPGTATGEVVFNTAMTGYQEILTDPSYTRQIVTLTYPHIGNTGTNPEDLESGGIHAAGLVIRDLPLLHSNWRATESLPEFLQRGGVVAIAEIDTRKLTRILREKGAQAGCIASGDAASRPQLAVQAARRFPGLKGMDLAKVVTTKRSFQWNEGTNWSLEQGPRRRPGQRLHVVAYDYGIKRNILRLLADHGCRMTVVPAQTPAAEVMALAAGRRVPVERPRRPRALRLRDHGDQAVPRGARADLRHLPRPPAARPRDRRAHDQDEVRPSRGQPSGASISTPVASTSRARTTASRSTRPRCPRACARRTVRCSTARCRASPAPTGPRSASRVTPRRVPVRATCEPLFSHFVESMLRKGAMPQRKLV